MTALTGSKLRGGGERRIRRYTSVLGAVVGIIFPIIASKADDGISSGPPVKEIHLELDSAAQESLRRDPRSYVRARVVAEGESFSPVGVHLKGTTGSFRPLEDKPSFTVDFARYAPDQRFRGTSKIHLNNSVEDPSYLCEWLGHNLFTAAQIPSPAVSHALVWLGDRRLGLYVLKEGFTAQFLEGIQPELRGTILEPERGADIDGRMLWRVGPPAAVSHFFTPLEALVRAVREPDLELRWDQLRETLALDQFLDFQALEVLLGHRDGYTLAKNNFRLLLTSDNPRVHFLPHGMDQLFQPADLPWDPHCAGLVARAIQEIPVGRQRYAERLRDLYDNLLTRPELTNQIPGIVAHLSSALRSKEAADLQMAAAKLSDRIGVRVASLKQQFAEPAPLELTGEEMTLTHWRTAAPPPEGSHWETSTSREERPTLRIVAGPATLASWWTNVKLSPGRYQFEGRARTSSVRPLPFGQNQGVALRVSGDRPRSSGWTGDSEWRPLTVSFAVTLPEEEVRLFCELRASAGEVWFETESLLLRKLE